MTADRVVKAAGDGTSAVGDLFAVILGMSPKERRCRGYSSTKIGQQMEHDPGESRAFPSAQTLARCGT